MSEIKLMLATFADPLTVQLEKQGYRFKSEKDERRSQKLCNAWYVLWVHGIQTVGVAQETRKRLMKSIMESIEPRGHT